MNNAEVFKGGRFTQAPETPPESPNINFSGAHKKATVGGYKKSDFPTTQDVLSVQLGQFASREKEDFLGTQHEMKTGQILRRSWESEDEVRTRAKKFRKDNGAAPKSPTVSVSPQQAKRELERMEKAHRAVPIPQQDGIALDKRREDWRYMNQLRESLDMEPHDYEHRALPDKNAEAANRFAAFSRKTDADDRRVACAVSVDIDVMRLASLNDPDERVRKAAEDRYGQLLVGAK